MIESAMHRLRSKKETSKRGYKATSCPLRSRNVSRTPVSPSLHFALKFKVNSTMLGFLTLTLLATSTLASPLSHLLERNNDGQVPNVVRSTWDGKCFYPTADETFKLDAYLGTWYQIAGTVAPFTAGCTCITANYALNVSGIDFHL